MTKKSGKTWSPSTIQLTVHPQIPPNTIPHLLGRPCCWLPGLLHICLHGERAVERYTASPLPTTPLQSYTAYVYSIIQRCILYSYTAYTLYSTIQSPSGVCTVGTGTDGDNASTLAHASCLQMLESGMSCHVCITCHHPAVILTHLMPRAHKRGKNTDFNVKQREDLPS